jgi:hypothetical protein
MVASSRGVSSSRSRGASSSRSKGESSAAGGRSRYHEDQLEIEEGVLLRMRTAVGNGNEMVDLSGDEDHILGDLEVRRRLNP